VRVMPSFATLKVQSAVPGRIRYEVRSVLWRQPERAAATEMALAQISGVRSTVANPLTGCLLVYYDTPLTSAEVERLVLEVLASLPVRADSCQTVGDQPALRSPDRVAENAEQKTNGHDHDHGSEHLDGQVSNLLIGGTVLVGLLAFNVLPGLGSLAAHPLMFAHGVQ
jgi:hypothetical protein